MAAIIDKSGAIEIRVLMAEVPLDILNAVSARKVLIINRIWVIFAYPMATLPIYPHTPLKYNAMHLLELSRLFLFASFLAMISASPSASLCRPWHPCLVRCRAILPREFMGRNSEELMLGPVDRNTGS
jgi:hypothetical protein